MKVFNILLITLLFISTITNTTMSMSGPCKIDQDTFCSDTEKNHKKVITCLMKNHSKLSEGCQQEIKKIKQKMHPCHKDKSSQACKKSLKKKSKTKKD